MKDADDRHLALLTEMRDILREELRLRNLGLDEQRAFQARAEASIATAGKKQRTFTLVILAVLAILFGLSYIAPLVLWLGSLASGGSARLAADGAVIPSSVETSRFDGRYALVPEASFSALRRSRDAETSPERRALADEIIRREVDQYANFRIHRGVIRSGTALVQEFSLRGARVAGDELRANAVWHEDVGDPGDMSEVPIVLRLNGDLLEFEMLGEEGEAGDPIVLRRVASAEPVGASLPTASPTADRD